MIKNAFEKLIGLPEKGWIFGEDGYMEIDYFGGNPFPENIANISFDEDIDETEDEDGYLSISDDEFDESEDSDEEWEPKKH